MSGFSKRQAAARLVLVLGLAVAIWGQVRFDRRDQVPGTQLTLAGLLLVALGSALRGAAGEEDGATPATSATPARAPLGRAEWVFLGLVTVAAGLLRFPGLDTMPPGGFFDEAQNVLVASRILQGETPALYFYPVALAISFFGQGIATIRGVSALFGTLAIPLVYLVARRFFSLPVAAAAAILLCGSRWHINFSRIGFNGILCTFFELAAVLAFVQAVDAGSFRAGLRYWVFFGLAVGVGLQTYYAFNLFPAVLLAGLVGFFWKGGLRTSWASLKPSLPGLLLSVGVATLVLLPLAIFAVRHPDEFFQRAGKVAIWSPAHKLPWPDALFSNAAIHLRMFQFSGDGNPRHNLQAMPMLNSCEGVLLVFGLGCALGAPLRRGRLLLLAWFGVMLLPGILTIEAPQAYRTIGVTPALALLSALAMSTVAWILLPAGWSSRTRQAISLLFPLLALYPALQNVTTYFQRQVKDRSTWNGFDAVQREMTRFLKKEAPDSTVFIDPAVFDVPVFRVELGPRFVSYRLRLSDHIPERRRVEGWDPPEVGPKGVLFLFDAFQQDLWPLLSSVFPSATSERHIDPFGRPMFFSVRVPKSAYEAGTPPSLSGKGYRASYYANETWGETAGPESLEPPRLLRREAAILFHFHWDQDALPDPFTSDWTARLSIETPGTYEWKLLAGSPTVVLVNGQPAVTQRLFENLEPLTGTVTLEAGDVVLGVRYLEKGFASTVRFWWKPPGGQWETIPLRLLTPLDDAAYAAFRASSPKPVAERR